MYKRFIYLFILITLLLLLPISLVSSLRSRTVHSLAPLAAFLVRQNTSAVNFFENIGQIASLRQDNQNLEGQIISLQQQVVQDQDLARENTALRQELGVTGITRTLPKVYAQIILQGSDPLDRTFTIDVGTAQGVKVGQPAVSQGYLVGRVISASTNSAIVRSIASVNSRVQAWLADSQEKGLLLGDGNTVYLSDITQGVKVKANTIIETDYLDNSLPQGILIGQTGVTQSKPSDLSQKFLVTLPQNPNAIEAMFILLTNSQ